MSEMQDTLSTTVTQATETAQSRITSTVKSQAHCIRGEIRSLGEKLQDIKGYYKGQVGVVFIKHVYILFVGPRTFPRGYLLGKARVSFKS